LAEKVNIFRGVNNKMEIRACVAIYIYPFL
jgi:hypothetical protein